MLKINSKNGQMKMKIDEGTNVKDILEIMQDQYQIQKKVKHWTCYSLTKKQVLNHQYVFKNQENQELQVFYEIKEDFSDLDQQKQEQTLNSQLSTNRQSTHRSEENCSYKKIIILDGLQQCLEIEDQTTIKELLEYLAKENKIEIQEVQQWSCFSETQNRIMKFCEQVGCLENEVLQIKTNKPKTHQLMHTQSCGNLHIQKQYLLISQQLLKTEESLLNYISTITLTYTILDNNVERERTALFLNSSKIDEIAKDTLQYTSLSIKKVSIDIFINGQQYNNPDKRNMTFEQIQLSKQDKINAQIRWLN
ncbi:unnamed protein product [Paramecium sonneborni]|uniref:Uncharacterized protein n=1 Tax=Paramecium sonneborni TaxID=65129 RepID=A0A8S1N4R1_9CILI|nr:unnamed protein product [Paramecium sonneborni]